MDLDDEVVANVTGETYKGALTQMALINQAVEQKRGIGFDNWRDCDLFAADHNLNLFVYHATTGHFGRIDQNGSMLNHTEWKAQFKNVLFYTQKDEDTGKNRRIAWEPDGYTSRISAMIRGEKSDGIREPLHERNFFVPTGYRNPKTGKFNSASPFKFFAEETGADTSFIYEFLNHLAGDNTLYLLAWLRQKMCFPMRKTEVMPIFIGEQGSGKTIFADFLCRAMFGFENVVVDVNFNGSSRFNAEYSDALIVSIEEKTIDDKYNILSVLKSLATATTVRKEAKGVDAVYQDNHTEFIMTTNEFVPVKFDSQRQRRFMVMETDGEFIRPKDTDVWSETHKLADEVFTKITGVSLDGSQVGEKLYNNAPVMKQFKHELLTDPQLENVSPKNFKETDAFRRCFSIPRSIEIAGIEATIKSLAPFAYDTLKTGQVVDMVHDAQSDELRSLSDITDVTDGLIYQRKHLDRPSRVGINRMAVFQDSKGQPFSHASIDKVAHDLKRWLQETWSLEVMSDTDPPTNGGFPKVIGIYRYSPVLWFCSIEDKKNAITLPKIISPSKSPLRPENKVYRQRYDDKYQPNVKGNMEVLNPLKPGTDRRSENVETMSTFLLESDMTSQEFKELERSRLQEAKANKIPSLRAEELYLERLEVQRAEAVRLIRDGVAWRAVYAGHKSIHILVTVADSPTTIEERRWLDAYLKLICSQRLIFDLSASDPARLTKAPIDYERTEIDDGVKVMGLQAVIRENKAFKPYDINWRPLYHQWLNNKRHSYEVGDRKMLPSKGIYKEACMALMDGTFWTDRKWDGQRNEVFFAGYRMMRAQGLSYKDVWDNLTEDVKKFYKKQDIEYWISRKDGKLIAEIEAEFEAEGI